MEKVYLLIHEHNVNIDEFVFPEVKLIGIYESSQLADETIDAYLNYVGFKDYPRKCFKIVEYELDKIYWNEGFKICENNFDKDCLV